MAALQHMFTPRVRHTDGHLALYKNVVRGKLAEGAEGQLSESHFETEMMQKFKMSSLPVTVV